jgi:hypothetical protein
VIAISPHNAACEEILLEENTPIQEAAYIRDEEHLRELWRIDCEAYQDHSLAFEPFLDWWRRYPYGSNNLLINGEIVASIGLYPIGAEQAAAFAAGQIAEKDLQPISLATCEGAGVAEWYFSGLVVVPKWQNRGLVRRLLRIGFGSWSARGHLRYPVKLYGLAQTEPGRKALQWFGMNRAIEGARLPDGLDLHAIEIESNATLKTHLYRRGI